MQKFLSLAMVLIIAMQLSAQSGSTVTIGEYSTDTHYDMPLNTWQDYSYTQSIYPADSLQRGGVITALSYKYAYGLNLVVNPVIIYLSEVNRSSFASTFDYVPLSELTEVFNGNVAYSEGWVTITLDEPFVYTGEGNLVVACRNGNEIALEQSYVFNSVNMPSSGLSYYQSDEEVSVSNPTTATKYLRDYVPAIKVHFSEEAADVCYPPVNVTVSNITSDAVTVSWNVLESYNPSAYNVSYKATDSEEWVDMPSTSELSMTLTSLESLTRYEVRVSSVCSQGNESRGVFRNFLTAPEENTLYSVPFTENFDNDDNLDKWITQNVSMNKWFHGTAENNTANESGDLTSGGSMYISSDNGLTNCYDNSSSSISYLSVMVRFGESSDFNLSFDRKQLGEGIYDYLKVYLMDADAVLSDNNMPDEVFAITDKLSETGEEEALWMNEQILIPGSCSNSVKKLVFVWKNDGSDGDNPPSAVDNVSIRGMSCLALTDISIETEEADGHASANVLFTDSNENTQEYIVEYRSETESEWTVLITSAPVVIPDLMYGTRYEMRIKAVCSETDTSFSSETLTFNTGCGIFTEFPWFTSFEETFEEADGIIGNENIPLCWYNINGGNDYYKWERNRGYFDVETTLKYSGETGYTEDSFSDWVISPVFELSAGQSLHFKAKAPYENNAPVLKIYAKDVVPDITSANDTTGFMLVEEIPLFISEDFMDYEIGLMEYSGPTRFALVVNQKSSTFYIDSLSINNMLPCPNVYNVTAEIVSSTSVSINFSTSNNAGYGWDIAYGQAGSIEEFDPAAASIEEVNVVDELPYVVSGLEPGETYYFAVKQGCENGAFSEIMTMTMPNTVALPYSQDFEDLESFDEWSFVHQTAGDNKWHIGSAINNTTNGSNALYVTNDDGTTNTYTAPGYYETDYVYAYANVEFGEGNGFLLSYDWRGEGNNENYMKVYLLPLDEELSTSSLPYSGDISGNRRGESEWHRDSIFLDGSFANTTKKLVFAWRSFGNEAFPPAAAVDNISFTVRQCVELEDLELTTTNGSEGASIIVSFSDPNDCGNYLIEYQVYDYEGENTEWISIPNVSETTYVISGLEYSTPYYIRVKAQCSDNSFSDFIEDGIITPCGVLTAPWTENFDENVDDNCWNKMEGLFIGMVSESDLSESYYSWNYSEDEVNGQVDGRMKVNVYGSTNNWLITPSIDLGDGTIVYQIAVDVMLTAYGDDAEPTDASDDRFAILVSTDNGATWSSSNSLVYADTDSDPHHNFSDLGRTATRAIYKLVDANDQPVSGVVKFAFYAESTQENGDNDLYIDNIEVSPWIPCSVPENIEVSDITAYSATISFEGSEDANEWQIRLGTSGEIETITINTHTFEDLTTATDYTVYLRTDCGDAYSEWVSVAFTTASEGVVNPVVTTVDASNITETEATLNATVVEGTETITARGFKYKTTESTDWTDVAATGTTTLTATLTDLTPATSYDFKAYVTVGTEEFEGGVLTFTTENTVVEIVMGEVSTENASDINDHTAVLHGTLTSNGGDDSYTVGFLISTMEDFDMETPDVVTLAATENAGALTANATDLESGTNYFFRAYITNDAGTAYGDIKTFVTTSGLSDAEGSLSAVIYPNPASGKATIEIEGLNESARLLVTDLQGRVLSSDDLRSGAKTYEMDLTGLASGVYYIRIVTDNAVSTQKLIVK